MRHRTDNEGRGGFTLLEIMIVIAILGIVAVIGVTNFGGSWRSTGWRTETKQIYADLMDARGRAMQRNRMFFVQIRRDGYQTREDTNPPPDGNENLESGRRRCRQRFRGAHDHLHPRRAFRFPQPERHRLGQRGSSGSRRLK